MATLTIKNLPDEIYAALSDKAKRSRRSINSEMINLLEHFFGRPKQSVEDELEEIRHFRERLARKGVFLNSEILEEAKRGRRF